MSIAVLPRIRVARHSGRPANELPYVSSCGGELAFGERGNMFGAYGQRS